MRITNYNLLLIVLLLLGFICKAQNPLNGRFTITGVSENPISPTSNYTIEGDFVDPNSIYKGWDILKGDIIADSEGKLFRIDSITTHADINTGSEHIKTDVTYLSGAIDEYTKYPANFSTGTLFHPTPNGYALATFDPQYPNQALMTSVQNAAIQAIDQTVTGYNSGTVFPTSPKLGDGFYNTTEKKLYIYTGVVWIPIGSGVVPSGTSTDFPNPAKAGEMFFNTEDNSSYIYNGTIWLKISTNGSVPSGIFNPDPATVTVNEGSLFYNTSDHKLYVYNKTVWMPVDNI